MTFPDTVKSSRTHAELLSHDARHWDFHRFLTCPPPHANGAYLFGGELPGVHILMSRRSACSKCAPATSTPDWIAFLISALSGRGTGGGGGVGGTLKASGIMASFVTMTDGGLFLSERTNSVASILVIPDACMLMRKYSRIDSDRRRIRNARCFIASDACSIASAIASLLRMNLATFVALTVSSPVRPSSVSWMTSTGRSSEASSASNDLYCSTNL